MLPATATRLFHSSRERLSSHSVTQTRNYPDTAVGFQLASSLSGTRSFLTLSHPTWLCSQPDRHTFRVPKVSFATRARYAGHVMAFPESLNYFAGRTVRRQRVVRLTAGRCVSQKISKAQRKELGEVRHFNFFYTQKTHQVLPFDR